VPSLGYTILAHKKKLKADYAHLPGPEIGRLRKEGVEVQYDVDDPLLTFIGDCNGATLLEQEHIWSSPILILEATFLEPGSARDQESAHAPLGDRARSRCSAIE
jgi:ribonuclease Z